MAKRAAVMAETKQETERDLHAATARLADQAAAARTSLERDAAALAGDIVGRVLGRTA
jgi:F0F1-type ATP synthase membrane subunit b/b'